MCRCGPLPGHCHLPLWPLPGQCHAPLRPLPGHSTHLALLEGEGGPHPLLAEQLGQQDGHQGQRVDLGHRRGGNDLRKGGQPARGSAAGP